MTRWDPHAPDWLAASFMHANSGLGGSSGGVAVCLCVCDFLNPFRAVCVFSRYGLLMLSPSCTVLVIRICHAVHLYSML